MNWLVNRILFFVQGRKTSAEKGMALCLEVASSVRNIPGMSLEHTIDVFGSQNGDKIRGLLDLNTVLVVDKTRVGKRMLILTREHEVFANNIVDGFGNVLIRAC